VPLNGSAENAVKVKDESDEEEDGGDEGGDKKAKKLSKQANRERQIEEIIKGLQVKQVFRNIRTKSDFWTDEDQGPPEGQQHEEEEEDVYDWDQVLGSVVGEDEVPFDETQASEDDISEDEDEDVKDEEDVIMTNNQDEAQSIPRPIQIKEEDEDEDEDNAAQVVEESSIDEVMFVKEKQGKRARAGDDGQSARRQAKRPKASDGNKQGKRKRGNNQDDDEPDTRHSVKESRKTTNKGKVGTHFYDTHNVKNKNRNKPAAGKPAANKSPKKKLKK